MSPPTPYQSAWARGQIWATAVTYTTAAAMLTTLTHCTKPGMEPIPHNPSCCIWTTVAHWVKDPGIVSGCVGLISALAQWVKVLALPQLWLEFNPWSRNFHTAWEWQKKKKKKKLMLKFKKIMIKRSGQMQLKTSCQYTFHVSVKSCSVLQRN